MTLKPWYKVVTPRPEVMQGRSFSPDEFAIALEQVVAGKAPEDYRDPAQFLSRTVFTGALRKHLGMVLRRLDGRTANTAPVLSLVTQFGGGKTHTLTALYHLVSADSAALSGFDDLRRDLDLSAWPRARTAVFVGGAWDPRPGRETPWMDIAWQLAGDAGLAALGDSARTIPPGTEALSRVFAAANGPVLLLFDEVLNYLNRHRRAAEHFHAFLQNLTVAVTGTEQAVAIVSLPRSQTEMTPEDQVWQDRITKLVRRVARDLMANDESDISEVVRRRLFEDLGDRKVRRRVAKAYAQWCFERSARLPPEWLAADAVAGNAGAREILTRRFEACYPFHPATLSVFRRKWQTLPQFQQTRGTLAMLAQWISRALLSALNEPRKEPFITLGSAPLDEPDFRTVVVGQLGQPRLDPAIGADLTGETARCLPLDADARGPLYRLHRRVGAAILFESSGGQVDKVAHLPELRFALGGPDLDTTSIDNAANALETSAFFIRRDGTDGYRIHHEPTLTKVVADRRASLDEKEVGAALREFVKKQFEARGRARRRTGVVFFPEDSSKVPDSPRLTLVVLDPETEWRPEEEAVARRLAAWTARRGLSPRLHSGCLVWCLRTPGRGLRDRIETWLAWKRVESEVTRGDHGKDRPVQRVRSEVSDAERAARDEVWAGYRVLAISDRRDPSGLRILDLGAGYASAGKLLPDHLLDALRSEGILNETVGAGYIDRNWPPQFADSGAWPLSGLRQSFLSGALTRLLDTDEVLRQKIPEFVRKREFGLASIINDDGRYGRLWYGEMVAEEEVEFDKEVYLLTRKKAEEARKKEDDPDDDSGGDDDNGGKRGDIAPPPPKPVHPDPPTPATTTTLRLAGSVPAESWNRLGATIVTRMRAPGKPLRAEIALSVTMPSKDAETLERDLQRQLADLNLEATLRVRRTVDSDER